MAYEWLIDAIKEWVEDQDYATEAYSDTQDLWVKSWVLLQSYLQHSYVDRGPVGARDWVVGDFIKNGAWHDLDTSAIVPAGVTGVLFQIRLQAESAFETMNLKRKGMGPAFYSSLGITQVADILICFDCVCAVDGDRKIEYAISVATWNIVDLTVKGWWL